MIHRLALLALAAGVLAAQPIPLARLEAQKAIASLVTYHGKEATRLVAADPSIDRNGMALLKGPDFQDGIIEVDLAGQPAASAIAGARGFIGVAFRVQTNGAHELIYLRPTNGRADDMFRRNHSTQYVSEPEWPWERLRKEFPSLYESYTDLETGAWTHYKVIVKGVRAELYVNGAAQPCLIVKDLRLGPIPGRIALWIGPGTEGHFANLKVSPNP